METARHGLFNVAHHAGRAMPASELSARDTVLRREERDAAILAGKLPGYEQDHDRRDELTLANWLALMNF